jgi:hypothetical protein
MMPAPKKKFKDAFPPDGPVRDYLPLILKTAKWYAHHYRLRRRDVIAEAVLIAQAAEEKFDPARGTFGTLLRWELRRLLEKSGAEDDIAARVFRTPA